MLGLVILAGCGSSSDTASSAKPAPNEPSLAPPATGQVAAHADSAGSGAGQPLAPVTPQQAAAQADVPVYPGAKFPDGVTMPPSKDSSGKVHTYLVMTTRDSPEKVAAFYEKSGGHYSLMQMKGGSEVQGMSPEGNLVLIDLTVSGGLTTISVKSVQGS